MDNLWLFIAALLIVQVIGLLTFLHFNSTIKKLKRDNKRIKHIIEPDSKSNHERLGMTKERYDRCMDIVYGMREEEVHIYNPYALQVIEDEPKQTDYDNFNYLSPIPKEEDNTEERLSELLGIEDMNEIDRIQKEIENNQEELSARKEATVNDKKLPEPNNELDDLSSDLESLFENEMAEPISGENQVVGKEKEEGNIKKGPRKTIIGDGETLFNEIYTALNGEEPKKEEILFSEEESPVDYETPIILDAEGNIPITDEDIPYIPEAVEDEQEKLISVLNLLDNENSRLEKEVVKNPITGKEDRKQVLTNRLSLLAEQGEGKDYMKEIVNTLMELYQLEGKEKEMRAIKEEYKEYFTKDEMELRIFEEDIIRVDKKKKDPFELPKKYLWIATNSISDEKIGEQRWIGKCIGKNQNYIHFRDMSQRIWINVGKRIEQIEIGDLLAVFVDREEESITAKEVLTLKEVSEQEQLIVS
ncbi:hypothetical protein [Virgibacillus halodenitrificans]|uniref:hypothetical protein n=1 Tax=Virgibacillus halodenitrificans TaxID=1482 RepID=UPI000EF48F29|nr:hypothetical protein [Virgibacillus halodenitrificans]